MTELNEILNVPMDVKPISLDYEQMRVRLNEMLEPYKGIVVTEDNYKLCKEKKDEVGRIGRELDDTRKAIKKTYEKPLKDFEKEIKDLVAIADKVKKEISDQLDVFDNKRKEEKRNTAEQIIDEMVGEYQLKEKYAGQVELKKSFMNLTAKESDVRADIEAQCARLKQQQDDEESIKKIIENTCETQNKNLTAKLVPSVYISLIGKLETDEIIDRILKRGEEIRKMESDAEKKRTSQEAVRDLQSEEKPEQVERVQIKEKTPENVSGSISKDIYKVTFVITGTEDQQKAVSRFLKENGIAYKVESQFIIS